MKTITCRNDAGLEAVFTYDHDSCEYFLVSCDGIYSVKNAVSTSQNATTDGTTYNGEGLEQRNIVITANIRRNHRQNREFLSRVFKVHSEGTFIHEEDGDRREIKYRVENIEVAETGVIRPATISLICTDPYFTDAAGTIKIEMSQWYDDWEFECEIPEEGMEFGHRETDTIKQVDNESTKDVNTLPADLRAVIKADKRLCSTKGSWAWQEDQKLWLPSEVEVWGHNSWSEVGYGNGCGVQFPIFTGSLRHICKGQGKGKAEQGSRSYWWCDSPNASNTTYFCGVSYTWLLFKTKEDAHRAIKALFEIYERMGITVNKKKTRIVALRRGFTFK